MKICSNCGHELNDEMEFCPNCGTNVNGISNETTDSNHEDDDIEWYETDIFSVVLSPLMKSFDNGKFFLLTSNLLIDILVTSFLLSVPYMAYNIFKEKMLVEFSSSDKTVVFILVILELITAIFSFSYWMKRMEHLNNIYNANDEFKVIPFGSYLIQWAGEWIGIISGVLGLFILILSIANIKIISFEISFLMDFGLGIGITCIIVGIILVFIFRLVAEKLRVLTVIANNTKSLQNNNTQESSDDDYEEGQYNEYYNFFYIICILTTVGFMFAAMSAK